MAYKFDRRRFLIGGGSLVALPLFESLWPTKVLAQASNAPNLIIMKFPLGVINGEWKPSGSGSNFSLPNELSALEQYKSELIIPTELHNEVNVTGVHASSTAAFLTAQKPVPKVTDVKNASIDRVIAQKLGISTAPGVMQITAAGRSNPDLDYSSTYGTNLSWINATTPASAYNSPKAVFDTLFPNGVGPGQGGAQPVDPMARYQKNILDGVVSEIKSLKVKLSGPDNIKLDQYLTGVEEVQRSVASMEESSSQKSSESCKDPGDLNLSPDIYDIDQFTDVNLELIKLGLACGQMRIVTYLLDYAYGSHFPTNYHAYSHYNSGTGRKEKYRLLARRWGQKLALFLGKLESTRDATGKTLLDNSIVVLGSGIHDGQSHARTELPMILAGRGGGMKPNRVISTNAQLGNLWVAIARRMGTPIDKIGRSDGDLGI